MEIYVGMHRNSSPRKKVTSCCERRRCTGTSYIIISTVITVGALMGDGYPLYMFYNNFLSLILNLFYMNIIY